MKHLNIKVYGLVQGVNFRAYTKRKAFELKINGFVKNEGDGTVYIEAEGDDEELLKFSEFCHRGPERATVDKVEIMESNIQNFKGFSIVY